MNSKRSRTVAMIGSLKMEPTRSCTEVLASGAARGGSLVGYLGIADGR